ncbi:MAG: hypothetical protein F6K36_08730 [Symploca sp. SIO3C6]|nr:hypothetical protein [Symploca sp. SIO3C6]
MQKELVVWLMFTVVASLIPVMLDYCGRIITTNRRPDSEEFFSDGQLLLIAVVLGSEAMGGVILTDKNYSLWQIITIGSGFITTLCAGLLYPFILNAQQTGNLKDRKFVIKSIFLLFLISLGTSFICKAISL